MSIIPDFVLSLVMAHLTPLLHWFSDRVYADPAMWAWLFAQRRPIS
jgi:hypothetical protein